MDLCFSFSFRLLSFVSGGERVVFSFLFVCFGLLFGGSGEGETLWGPHYDRASWSEGRKGVYRGKRAVILS